MPIGTCKYPVDGRGFSNLGINGQSEYYKVYFPIWQYTSAFLLKQRLNYASKTVQMSFTFVQSLGKARHSWLKCINYWFKGIESSQVYGENTKEGLNIFFVAILLVHLS